MCMYMCMWGGGGGYVCVYRFCIMFYFLLTCFLFFIFSNIQNRRLLPRVTLSPSVPFLFKSEHLTILFGTKSHSKVSVISFFSEKKLGSKLPA